MAKTKKISVNAFEKAMKNTYEAGDTFDWNGIEVTVKKNLSFKEMMEFVDSVVKCCFTNDTNVYLPEVKDFMIKVCTLEKYANFTMPNNVESQYALVYQTDAVDHVFLHINPTQFNEICVAIDKKIDNMAQSNVEAVNKQMNDIYSAFKGLHAQIEKLFEGVDSDDMKAIAGALANGGMNEEKIVEAYARYNGLKASKAGGQ